MLTAYDDDEAMMSAVIANAAGYVLKDIRGSGLVDVVKKVASGRSALDPALVRVVRDRLSAATGRRSPAGLPEPARAGGARPDRRRAHEPADRHRLSLTEKTVKNYVSSLLAKLGLQSRTQAAVLQLETRRTQSGPVRR